MIVNWPDHALLTSVVGNDEGWVPFNYSWEQVKGPASATILSPTADVTEVSFPETQGEYLFKITVSGEEPVSDFEDFWLTEDGETLETETGSPIIMEETVIESVLGSALFRVYVLATVAPEASGPTIQGKTLIVLSGVVDLTDYLDYDSLTINETNDSSPNTVSFTLRGTSLGIGQHIAFYLDEEIIFAGQYHRDSQVNFEKITNDSFSATVTDYTWHLSRRKVTGKFVQVSASTVAQYVISKAPGFGLNVQGGLPLITIEFDDVTVAEALGNICSQIPGCTWKATYAKVVRLGTFDVARPAPQPITMIHPTLRDFSIDRDLGNWITKVRVYGPQTTSAKDFKGGGGTIIVHSIKGFLDTGGNIMVDGHENIFSGAGTREIQEETSSDASAPGDDAETADEKMRRTYVNVRARAIRVGGKGLAITVDDEFIVHDTYRHFTTYVMDGGETYWKQEFITTLPVAYDEISHKRRPYNAIEFIADALPPSVTRINIYRELSTSPGSGRLVGSLSTKGTFGELGTSQAIVGEEGGGKPFDIGMVISQSSGSLVDFHSEAELGEATALPLPSFNTHSTAPSDSVTGTSKKVTENYLYGVNTMEDVADGSNIRRYVDVTGSSASDLGTLLGDDGIVEASLKNSDLETLQEMINAGQAFLATRNGYDRGIRYNCRDQNTHPGCYVSVSMPSPMVCSGDFLIQSVSISGFGPVSDGGPFKCWPLYTVTKAAPRELRITNLLQSMSR